MGIILSVLWDLFDISESDVIVTDIRREDPGPSRVVTETRKADTERKKADAETKNKEHRRPVTERRTTVIETKRVDKDTGRAVTERKVVTETRKTEGETKGVVTETTKPVADTKKVETETTKPVPETTRPVQETKKPETEAKKVVTETTRPVPDTRKAETETTKPVPETTKTVPETTKPVQQTIIPVAGTTKADTKPRKEDKDEVADLNKFETAALFEHNRLRALHGCPPLKINSTLTNLAEEWVNKLSLENTMQHRPNNKYGENIYWSSGKPPNAKESVDSWYDEIKMYKFDTGGFSPQTGHFTQVVWKNTSEVGCGLAIKGTTMWFCCNYNPRGNVKGRYQENVPPPQKRF